MKWRENHVLLCGWKLHIYNPEVLKAPEMRRNQLTKANKAKGGQHRRVWTQEQQLQNRGRWWLLQRCSGDPKHSLKISNTGWPPKLLESCRTQPSSKTIWATWSFKLPESSFVLANARHISNKSVIVWTCPQRPCVVSLILSATVWRGH